MHRIPRPGVGFAIGFGFAPDPAVGFGLCAGSEAHLVSSEEPAPTYIPSPQEDARALLRWVAEAGYAGEPVLAEDMERAYQLMCRANARAAYPWQLVGEPLRQLTGGVKQYTRIRLERGGPKRHRRRVYQIPS